MDIHVKQFIELYGNQQFLDAIDSLELNSIVFEGQFPFLNDTSMRGNRYHLITEAFSFFGFNKEVHCLSWNITNQGYMHCIFFLEDLFDTTEDVKKVHFNHFSKLVF